MKNFAWLLILALLPTTVWAQEVIDIKANDFKPMAYQEEGEMVGFDVDLWEAIGEEIGRGVDFSLADSPAETIKAVSDGEATVGAGGITITEKRMRDGAHFSMPYFNSGLSILALGSKDTGFFATAKSLMSWGTVQAFVAMLVSCFLFGILFWWFERGSPSIQDDPRLGIPEGSYLAMASNTTIGFGDITPTRWAGRFCVLLAWWFGAIPVGWMTARMAAAEGYSLENTSISSVEDLRGKKIIVEKDTATVDAVKALGAKVLEARDPLSMLFAKEGEVIVHDTPGVLYYANGEGAGRTVAVGDQFDEQYYGFVINDPELRDTVNLAIMSLKRKGTYDKIYRRWFGE